MNREAEVLEMPRGGESDAVTARRIAQGRSVVERYAERLDIATDHLDPPAASEVYCALGELHEGLIENDSAQVESDYRKAQELFPQSHIANMGLRRLSRVEGDYGAVLASLECELQGATRPENRRALQLELARTYLYCECDAEKTIAILEMLEGDAGDASTYTSETETFDPEVFLLWEDALLATGAWDRYVGKLREALKQQSETGMMTQHIEERLWLLYRYLMPDAQQAALLSHHLMCHQPLDDELVDDALMRAVNEASKDERVDILTKAVERLVGSPRADFYRALLADVAAFDFDDPDHAIDVLSELSSTSDLFLLHPLIELLSDGDRVEDMLSIVVRCLESLGSPQQKAEQLYAIACIMRDEIENEDAAFDVLREAIDTYPSHAPTVEALAEIYTRRAEWENLAQLYELELSYAIEHQIPEYTPELFAIRHARLAQIYEQLGFALNAFNHYKAVLAIKPDDIAALKGASRMAQCGGNWTELLQLYATAEGCTQDTREHSYLLERIAQIADVYLNDADTACTALEALRAIDPNFSSSLAALARLYLKLEKWDALIALTDEEIATVNDSEYKATLLCKNGEISERHLSNIPQAILYYEKARQASKTNREAMFALESLYTHQKAWEKLVDLYKSAVSLTSDVMVKGTYLRKMADTLEIELDSEEEAVAVYETCLQLNCHDYIARSYLLRYYRRLENWEDFIRILDAEYEAGGTMGMPWLTLYWKSRVELYRLNREENALETLARAVELHLDHIGLKRMWLLQARRLGHADIAKQKLKSWLSQISDEQARIDVEMAIADLTLEETRDMRSLEHFIDRKDILTRYKSCGSRFVSMGLVANDSAHGRWLSRLSLALLPRQTKEMKFHALLASIVLNMPDAVRDQAHDVLCAIGDGAIARRLWCALPPNKRPDFRRLDLALLDDPSSQAQDLRRWRVLSRLLNGIVDDPTDDLLPDCRDEALSYRPDLELLSAYFEKFEQWNKLLEVLMVQEKNACNEQEYIQVILQRAWVLEKVKQHENALVCVRQACRETSYDDDLRFKLYQYLERSADWDFLAEQIRLHIIEEKDRQIQSELWRRLADIYSNGMNNLEESLKCLNQAYQCDNSQGDVLCRISETAEKIGEFDIARRALDDYIRYHAPSLDEQLKLQPRLLELHFYKPGGDPLRIIAYFDDLLQKSVDARDCRIYLAKAHAMAGDPARAAQLILSVVDANIADEDLDLWCLLADLYLDKLDEPKQGEELLWKLFQMFPERESIFTRLNALYTTPAERKLFVANLEQSVNQSDAIRSNHSLVRKYLGFCANILGRELGIWKEAQDLFTRALEVSSEPSADLVKNRAYARCRVPGEARCAYEEFCQLLTDDPFQVDIYRAAFDICKRNRATDRERILKQLAQVFIPDAGLHLDATSLRPKMMDSRPLSDEVLLKHLSPAPLKHVQIMLHEAMPILSRALRDDVPRKTNLGGDKVKDPKITGLFDMCAQAFGIHGIKGFLGHDTSPIPTVLDDPPAYWIYADTWATLPQELQRHWAGYACGMLWTGISRLLYSDPQKIWRCLDGIYYLATGNGIVVRDAYTKEAAERIDTIFERGTRKAVATMIDEIGTENIPITAAPLWLDGIWATADRAGLLFSGSLGASLPAILLAEGWNPENTDQDYLAARYKQSKRLTPLVKFALSDDYLALRFHAGLAMKPSIING